MSDPRDDFDDLDRRLRAERPRLDEAAERRVRASVLDRVAGRPAASRRTSTGVALVLALGIVLTGGGAAAGISGLASDGTASIAQYSTPTPPVGATPTPPAGGTPSPPVRGSSSPPETTTTGTNDDTLGGTGGVQTSTQPSPAVGAAGDEEPTAPAADAPNQVVATGASGDTLPFTGFAAIPVVIAGALLIALGAVLRRRSSPGVR